MYNTSAKSAANDFKAIEIYLFKYIALQIHQHKCMQENIIIASKKYFSRIRAFFEICEKSNFIKKKKTLLIQ